MSGGMGGGQEGVPDDLLTTKGDTHGFTTENARVPIGADTTVLTADSTQALGLAWTAPVGAPTTTKGDISGFSTTQARIPIGVNSTVLTADSTEALGLKWAAVAGGPNTFYLQTGFPSTTVTYDNFLGFGSPDMGSNENEQQVAITDAFDVKRITCFAKTNSRSSNLSLSFRDDGADKGAVTITAGTSGQFDSGALTQSVAADSLINMKVNTSTGSGTLEIRYILIKGDIT